MTTTISWDVSTLERITSTGEIQTVHYTVDAVDTEDATYRAGAYGSVGLDPADPNNMVPYADVTKAQVIGWLHAKLGEEAVANVETALQAQIDEQHAPSKAAGVPWPA